MKPYAERISRKQIIKFQTFMTNHLQIAKRERIDDKWTAMEIKQRSTIVKYKPHIKSFEWKVN